MAGDMRLWHRRPASLPMVVRCSHSLQLVRTCMLLPLLSATVVPLVNTACYPGVPLSIATGGLPSLPERPPGGGYPWCYLLCGGHRRLAGTVYRPWPLYEDAQILSGPRPLRRPVVLSRSCRSKHASHTHIYSRRASQPLSSCRAGARPTCRHTCRLKSSRPQPAA